MIKRYVWICGLLLWALLPAAQTKVACVGNSITYGLKLENRETECYPARLQALLGKEYVVGNFGKSGATLLRRGHKPYVAQQEYRDALAFAADVVVIHLGINDTDPRNWPNYRDDFIEDYHALIADFRRVNPKCRVLIARMSPISNRHVRFDSGTRTWFFEIQEAIACVARHADVELIDFYEPLLSYPVHFPDGLHPNAAGAEVLAKVVYENLTGDFGGLQLPAVYSDNMVLQRNEPLTITGKGDAGEAVRVSIAGKEARGKVSANGTWSVTLPALEAGGPYTLQVASGGKRLTYRNVLVGEVWLCSGQSNMEWPLEKCATAATDLQAAANDRIRLYDMKPYRRPDAQAWSEAALDSLNRLEFFRPTSWTVCSAEAAAGFSAVAYHFGRMLQDSLQVPVGLICNALGGAPAEAWVGREALEREFPAIMRNWMQNDFVQDWVRKRALTNTQQAQTPLQRHPYEACYLYETAIRPLTSYRIKGCIWYQGESNAHNTEAHERLFKLLVNSWREAWQSAEMPFYYVQLSSLNRPSWCWFRDSQRRLLAEVAHSGMAVCTDIGDSLDVHPRRKKEVGERLARQALHHTYGKAWVVPSGPLYKGVVFEQGRAYVTFDHATGLTTSDGAPLREFELAGDNGRYHAARAEIVGDRVVVSSEAVQEPCRIRYAWRPFTRANLVNAAALPASTFQAAE